MTEALKLLQHRTFEDYAQFSLIATNFFFCSFIENSNNESSFGTTEVRVTKDVSNVSISAQKKGKFRLPLNDAATAFL